MGSRAKYQRQHSLRRIFQRYGIALTNAEYRAICAEVERGAAKEKCKTHWGGIIFGVSIKGREVNAVWKDGMIVTFLPFGVPMEMQPFFVPRERRPRPRRER